MYGPYLQSIPDFNSKSDIFTIKFTKEKSIISLWSIEEALACTQQDADHVQV